MTILNGWLKSAILITVRISGLGTAPTVLDSATVNSIAQAIQQQEGYYPGSLAYTNNNPGNLIYAGQSGATQGAGGFAAFPDYATGYQALLNQIQLYASRGMTISQMMAVYAPAGQGNNDPTAYANTVAAAVGASPDTALTDIGSTTDTTNPTSFMASLDPTSAGFSPLTLGLTAAGALLGVFLLSR